MVKQQKKDFKKQKAPNEQRSCGHSAHFIVGPNCGTDLVGRKELATLPQTTAQDDCLQQFPDGMNILWDTPLPLPFSVVGQTSYIAHITFVIHKLVGKKNF